MVAERGPASVLADGLSDDPVVRSHMKAVTSGGERIECNEFEEGSHGLVCYHDEWIVGYVPYEQLERVVETRTPVASSSIRSVGYDEDESVLEIEFESGGIYRYADVDRETRAELLGARSHGSYFHERIRGQYDYRRVR